MIDTGSDLADFIEAASVPLDANHSSGTLDDAEKILSAHPEVAQASIHSAAIVGDDTTVRTFIESDPQLATAKGGPRNWDSITYLCFSRYLRLDRARWPGFVRAATVLLDAGADANSGWFEASHQPRPVWESIIYGAAGIARNPDLTRLLLDRGADPNDEETPYHAPETYDNAALEVLVESGKLNDDSLATILLRKADWHDCAAIEWLLERGVKPDRVTRWGRTALQQALLRDNDTRTVEALLDHGADPRLVPAAGESLSPIQMAAHRGRRDVLELLRQRGIPLDLQGVEALLAACATDYAAEIANILQNDRRLADHLKHDGGRTLAVFAGNGNTDGVRNLLDLGIPVNAHWLHGDPYFGISPNSTALHVAAWRARHSTVKLLLERGADIEATDAAGQSPLQLAVKACVDSWWAERRSPESIEMLLRAGASTKGIRLPTGYTAIDDLLAR
jgi:ankyrin repeat protein